MILFNFFFHRTNYWVRKALNVPCFSVVSIILHILQEKTSSSYFYNGFSFNFFIGIIIFSLSDPCYIQGNRRIQYCSVTYKILRKTLEQWNPNVILLLKLFMNCIPKTYFASTKKKNQTVLVFLHIFIWVLYMTIEKKFPANFLIYLM